MTALFIVRATVPQADRDAFDTWYENEHLPEAKVAFKASSAWRGWSEDDPAVHTAWYEFPDLASVKRIINSDELKVMVVEFDRTWQQRVSRSREIVEVKQSV